MTEITNKTKSKSTRTHSISDELYVKFMEIVEDRSLNKSNIPKLP